ncbi:MAG TPA: hypothetical protein VHF22_01175 [Planctomycetota bacterium]|nr:hypothetical protein [Planctomycetota bacterium]
MLGAVHELIDEDPELPVCLGDLFTQTVELRTVVRRLGLELGAHAGLELLLRLDREIHLPDDLEDAVLKLVLTYRVPVANGLTGTHAAVAHVATPDVALLVLPAHADVPMPALLADDEPREPEDARTAALPLLLVPVGTEPLDLLPLLPRYDRRMRVLDDDPLVLLPQLDLHVALGRALRTGTARRPVLPVEDVELPLGAAARDHGARVDRVHEDLADRRVVPDPSVRRGGAAPVQCVRDRLEPAALLVPGVDLADDRGLCRVTQNELRAIGPLEARKARVGSELFLHGAGRGVEQTLPVLVLSRACGRVVDPVPRGAVGLHDEEVVAERRLSARREPSLRVLELVARDRRGELVEEVRCGRVLDRVEDGRRQATVGDTTARNVDDRLPRALDRLLVNGRFLEIVAGAAEPRLVPDQDRDDAPLVFALAARLEHRLEAGPLLEDVARHALIFVPRDDLVVVLPRPAQNGGLLLRNRLLLLRRRAAAVPECELHAAFPLSAALSRRSYPIPDLDESGSCSIRFASAARFRRRHAAIARRTMMALAPSRSKGGAVSSTTTRNVISSLLLPLGPLLSTGRDFAANYAQLPAFSTKRSSSYPSRPRSRPAA